MTNFEIGDIIELGWPLYARNRGDNWLQAREKYLLVGSRIVVVAIHVDVSGIAIYEGEELLLVGLSWAPTGFFAKFGPGRSLVAPGWAPHRKLGVLDFLAEI